MTSIVGKIKPIIRWFEVEEPGIAYFATAHPIKNTFTGAVRIFLTLVAAFIGAIIYIVILFGAGYATYVWCGPAFACSPWLGLAEVIGGSSLTITLAALPIACLCHADGKAY